MTHDFKFPNGEFMPFIDSYHDAGFRVPAGVSTGTLVQALSSVCLPGQIIPLDKVPISEDAVNYFQQEVAPQMRTTVSEHGAPSLEIAHRLGRLLAYGDTFYDDFLASPGVTIQAGILGADNHQRVIRFESERVLDLGMGLIGLKTHIENVSRGAYNLTSVQATKLEARLLDGYVSFHNIDPTKVVNKGTGLVRGTKDLLHTRHPKGIDLVIASNAQEGGSGLEYAIGHMPALLRVRGVFLARGKRDAVRTDHVGYGKIRKIIKANSTLHLDTDRDIPQVLPGPAPTRSMYTLLVGTKRSS